MIVTLAACAPDTADRAARTVLLTIENETRAQLWYFRYADCGSED